LELPKPDLIFNRLAVPSGSHWKSDKSTQAILRQGEARRSMLIEKWRKQLAHPDARRATEILRWFNLDVYDADDVLPRNRLWIDARAGGVRLADPATVEKS
jgi:hypothetical protein